MGVTLRPVRCAALTVALTAIIAATIPHAGTAQSGGTQQLKLMTLNIFHDEGSFWLAQFENLIPVAVLGKVPPVSQWDLHRVPSEQMLVHRAMGQRLSWIAAVIEREQPAVIGLQEALLWQVAALQRLFPRIEAVGEGRAGGSRGQSVSILFDTSRVRIACIETPQGCAPQSGTFWLSPTPGIRQSVFEAGDTPRIATWVRLRSRGTDRDLYVYNTHLPAASTYNAAYKRARGVRLILERIGDRGTNDPVVLMGDFNSSPGSTPIATVIEPQQTVWAPLASWKVWTNPFPMLDSYRMVHPTGDRPTNCKSRVAPSSEMEAVPSGKRIDFVFVSPDLTVTEARQGSVSGLGGCPSDHMPFVTTIVHE